MDMQQFFRDIRPRILISSFDDWMFRHADLQIRERSVNTRDMACWYAPWYYRDDAEVQLDELTARDRSVRAMRLSEVLLYSKDFDRNRDIAERPVPGSFLPFPVATDADTGRTLVLDGNRTLAAMLVRGIYRDVPVVEVRGRWLAGIIGSFALVNH